MKYFLILFFSIFYTTIIQCQVEAGEVGSRWIFGTHSFHDDSYDYSGTIPDESCSNDTLTIEKDTIIGGTNFKKVVDRNQNYELLNFDDNKISFYKMDSLYTYMDANANVGDTIIVSKNYIFNFFKLSGNSLDTLPSLGYVITEIDSVDISGSKYLRQKVVSISGSYYDFGDLIYPFGSIFQYEKYVSLLQMSMLGGSGQLYFFSHFFYNYSKYYEGKDETVIFFEDEIECQITSLEELSQLEISIFPNPISETLFINDDLNQILDIALYDINSKKILQIQKQDHLTKLNLSELSSGLYLLHLTLRNGDVKIQKLHKL